MSIVKKIFILSSVIFVLALLLWGVYNLSFKKPAQTADNGKTETKNDNALLPQDKTGGKISAVTDEEVISPVVIPGKNAIKYYSKTGAVYQIDNDGQNKTTISSKELPGLMNVFWSPDLTKVITKFSGQNDQPKFYFYDYSNQNSFELKKNIDEISWQTNANRIFYKYYDQATKTRSLNISDPDGSNWKKLADIDYRNIAIAQVPKSGLVSFWNVPDSYSQTVFESVPLIGGDKKTIYKEKFGADYLWSKDGNYVLVSSVDARAGSKMQLGVMNYNGGEYKNLDIPTFATKCVWSRDGKTIYYALPGNMPGSAILPNEYYEGKFRTSDTFWKVDIAEGKKTRLLETGEIDGSYDAWKLFLNEDESALFFINRRDGRLYKIGL